MSAIPAPNIWIPRRDILRPSCPNALFAAGARMLSSAGKVMLNAAGKQILDNGNGICCLYQARKCSDDSLAGSYVRKSDFPSFPSTFTFWDGSQCLYVQSTDTATCNSTPLATVVTTYADCPTCTSDHGGSAICTCPGTGMPSSVVVSGFGTIPTTCNGTGPPCFTPGTCTTTWDGTCNYIGSGTCQWRSPTGTCINGVPGACEILLVVGPTFCCWVIQFVCTNPPFGAGNCIIWDGYKLTGSTPLGTYAVDTGGTCNPSNPSPNGTPLSVTVS